MTIITKNTTAGRQVSQLSKMFAICSLRGCRRLNSSIASPMSTGMSRCTVRSVNPVSCCVVMDDRNGVLIHFRLLKDLSAEQLVIGRVHRMLISALMFGYIDIACLRAAAGLNGKLLCPCSFRCSCHFICQQCSSESTQPRDGRYMTESSLTLLSHSSGDKVTITDGTMDRPNKAVC